MKRELASVRDHAKRVRDSLYMRDNAIGLAHTAGFSLREIADAAGLSHQGVKKIIERG